jgi:pSer/pThr/pTyr-binding forkhead associated (FHA) protein
MLSLEVRKKTGGAEMHRVNGDAVTVGASSGNEVVVRARGVAGRHVRIFEKEGAYYLDLFKGVDAITVNGQTFLGGPISPGDRITIGEATVIITAARPPLRQTPIQELRVTDTATPPAAMAAPTTEVEYRGLRLNLYRICRETRSSEHLATELVDFLDREFAPSEWAVGEFTPAAGFRPLASTFLESPALPPRVLEDVEAGERVARAETVTGVLTLIVEPPRAGRASLAILVRESPRLAARAILLLEELVQTAGIAVATGAWNAPPPEREGTPVPVEVVAKPSADSLSVAALVLQETDDLKKIMDTVTKEVIDRAMRRAEGNQSRGAAVLNISRGSLIAKLKEYQIPDYRYLRRERSRRPERASRRAGLRSKVEGLKSGPGPGP